MDNPPPPPNPPNPNMSQQDLQAIVQAVMREMLNNNQAFNNARNINPPAPVPVGPDTRWRIEEFGLFEPDLPVDDRHPAGDVITVGRDTIYRNVDDFIERIKDAVATKGASTIRDNLHLCLRGAATRWYTFEVSDLNKQAMRTDVSPSLDQWVGHLTARFRPRMAQAVRENSDLLYHISDVRAGKPILTYFQSKLLCSRAAGFATVHSQLIQVYMGLDASLRRDLFEPTTTTTVDQYRELLMEKEEIWSDIYTANHNPYRQAQQSPRESYQPRPTLTSAPAWPKRTGTTQGTRANLPNARQATSPQPVSSLRNNNPPQPNQVTSPPEARLPCPFHAARGQTYYHSPLACRLPEARNLLSDNAAWIQQINFQSSHDTEPSEIEEIVPQYVDYDPDIDDDSQYDPSKDFYTPYGSDIMHNLVQHPSMVNPLPSDDRVYRVSEKGTLTYHASQEPNVLPTQECLACSATFPSKNKLFKHLHESKHFQTPPTEVPEIYHTEIVIKSTSEPVSGAGLSFRNYNFTEIQVNFDTKAPPVWVCLDSGCGMSCIDRKLLSDHVPYATVLTLPNPIQIRGLGSEVHHAGQYVVLPIYLPGTIDGSRVFGEVVKEFHIVDNLSCNILIGTDVIVPERIQIDIENRIAKISACKGMQCALRVTPRGQPLQQRSVSSAKDVVVKAHTSKRVPFKTKGPLPSDRDLRFEAHYTSSTAYLTLHGFFPEAIVDNTTDSVIFYNTSDSTIRIRKNERIGTITEWDRNCLATPESPETVNVMFGLSRVIPSFPTAVKFGLNALQCAQLYSSMSPGTVVHPSPDTMLRPVTDHYDSLSAPIYTLLPPLDPVQGSEAKFGAAAVNINTKDDITPGQVEALRKVIEKFPRLWEDRVGRVVEPEESWLQIPLKPGVTLESKGRYRVSKRDEAVIDEVFDAARKDGRMSAATSPNPVGWPVFVVWSKGKGRPVIDLRGLNSKVITDAYPLPRQDDVVNVLHGKYWIALLDLLKAYYQRMVALRDRWKLTVVSHRGQEVLNVAPMGYISSAAHMQKLMDEILEAHKAYAKCFVDDTVVFSDDFESHLQHLEAVLGMMESLGMTLSPAKCYVGYHSVELLGHHVDRFGRSTLEQKVEAIANLHFPINLRELEYFLGLTG